MTHIELEPHVRWTIVQRADRWVDCSPAVGKLWSQWLRQVWITTLHHFHVREQCICNHKKISIIWLDWGGGGLWYWFHRDRGNLRSVIGLFRIVFSVLSAAKTTSQDVGVLMSKVVYIFRKNCLRVDLYSYFNYTLGKMYPLVVTA